jgi:RNA polymerase sigma factor (sigma-70 family)
MSEAAFPWQKRQAPSVVWRLHTDEQLARRATRGDERAFAEIFRRYADSLYRFCLAMTGSPHDAQDALQNAMVKALRALPGEERQIKLKPWLYRVARNEAIEIVRRRREGEQLEPELLTDPGVAEAAEVRERLRTLLTDLELLSERQRAVLLMRELSGLDFADIGAAYQTSAAAARQTLYEARLNLRALEEGRERRCADVRKELSDSEGRAGRRSGIRAHLRGCAECRAFGEAIAQRRGELAALAPLPVAASLGLLRGLLGGGDGGTSGGALAGVLGPAAQTLAVPAAFKSAAVVALTVASVSVAGGGLLVTADGSVAAKPDETTASTAGNPRPLPAGTEADRATGAPSPSDPGDTPTSVPAAFGATGGSRDSSGHRPDSPDTHATAPASSPDEPGPARSQTGQDPPGGGYGKPASEHRGSPEQPPQAVGTGLQTAAEHGGGQAPATPGPPPNVGDPSKNLPPPKSTPAPTDHPSGGPPESRPPTSVSPDHGNSSAPPAPAPPAQGGPAHGQGAEHAAQPPGH